ATNVGAIAEIVQPEFSGFLIDVNDRGSLVEKLRYLLDNPSLRQTMGQNAFALVSDTFDAEANTMRLLTEIKEVADRQSWLTRQDGQHSKWQRAAQQPLQNRG
ncbi:MAG: glycosyltransferase, partial [Caldilineaceae bacterium]|nr:glycosyltransferase [Caldilineaceae bacterium]